MARPVTSQGAGARPSTASAAPGQPPHYLEPTPAYYPGGTGDSSRTFDEEEEDDYEEESEAEDVFAYLPPNSADGSVMPGGQSAPPSAYTDSRAVTGTTSGTASRGVTGQTNITSSSVPKTGSDADSFNIPANQPNSESFRMRSLPSTSPFPSDDKVPPHTASTNAAALSTIATTAPPSSREVRIQLPPPPNPTPASGKRTSSTAGNDSEYFPDIDYDPESTNGKTASPTSSSHARDLPPTTASGIDSAYYATSSYDDEDSPYPEVRASVSNIDDPDMPTTTVRMWVIGLFLTMVGASVNTFFNFRYPAPFLNPLVLLLIAHPIGKLCAYTWPIRPLRLPQKVFGGMEISLNPGPFNIKEHVLIYIMANVGVGPAYALNTIVVSQIHYGVKLGVGFNIMLVLGTQLTGFGIAGMCRRFLVWPASMIWPQNLVACTLLNTLHAEDDEMPGASGIGGMSRYKFFMICTSASFVWYFFPGFIFQALSVFSWVCWFKPKDIVVNQLFGVVSGLGMGVLTFDWSQISYIGSPLMVPWWAEVHIFLAFVIFYWFLCPILYYTDVWHFSHLPLSSLTPFDRFARPYNISAVMVGHSNTFDPAAYAEYSALYLPSTYAITYLVAFALSTCIISHTLLYHSRALVNGFKRLKVEEDDVHARLMRNYPEVPDWWYASCFFLFFAFVCICMEVWHTGVPIWALCLAISLPLIYVLPASFMYALTGQAVGINLVAEIIPGSLLPGQPITNMVFKSYAIQTMGMAISFVQDLKLGHYIKIPPRATFMVQGCATFIAAITEIGVQTWLFHSVPDICSPNQPHHLICPHNQVFYTASAIWGVIGPTRQFGSGTLYHPELYALIFGALLPLPFWLWQRKFPKTRLKYVSMPVFLNGISYVPPATGINYSSWFFTGFFFQYFLRRRNFRWWSKYNYLLSSALDSGTVLSVIFIFFTLQFPKGGNINLNWWGNTVFINTADVAGLPLLQTDPINGFAGPPGK